MTTVLGTGPRGDGRDGCIQAAARAGLLAAACAPGPAARPHVGQREAHRSGSSRWTLDREDRRDHAHRLLVRIDRVWIITDGTLRSRPRGDLFEDRSSRGGVVHPLSHRAACGCSGRRAFKLIDGPAAGTGILRWRLARSSVVLEHHVPGPTFLIYLRRLLQRWDARPRPASTCRLARHPGRCFSRARSHTLPPAKYEKA